MGKCIWEYAMDMNLNVLMKKRDKKFKILQNDLALQQLKMTLNYPFWSIRLDSQRPRNTLSFIK